MPRTPRTPKVRPAQEAPEPLLTAKETAERLGLALKTLQNWASTWDVEPRGPKPIRLFPNRGGIRYRQSEVFQMIRDALDGNSR
ncbi:helix-turn-helix transcriptional regulator [Streptomyces sp. NPDC005808]|uniref:helix-turn-helix transcriptional regulator n=1 Tax=Streptomyces sp. NPDC005808 TaxID=3364734 RepID=UPI0036BFB597